MQKISKRIQIRARLSYPHLFEPRAFGNAEPKYSSVLVIEDPHDQKLVAATLKEVAVEAFGEEKAKVVLKSVRETQIKQGEEATERGYPEGSIAITAKNKNKPGLVSRYADPKSGRAAEITEEQGTTANGPFEMYGGVVANVILSVFSYNHPTGGLGIGFGLDGVQRWDEGERFGGPPITDLFNLEMPGEADISDILEDEPEDDDPIADIL